MTTITSGDVEILGLDYQNAYYTEYRSVSSAMHGWEWNNIAVIFTSGSFVLGKVVRVGIEETPGLVSGGTTRLLGMSHITKVKSCMSD